MNVLSWSSTGWVPSTEAAVAPNMVERASTLSMVAPRASPVVFMTCWLVPMLLFRVRMVLPA